MTEENKNTNCNCDCDHGSCCGKKISRGCGATGGVCLRLSSYWGFSFLHSTSRNLWAGSLGRFKSHCLARLIGISAFRIFNKIIINGRRLKRHYCSWGTNY